MMMMMMMMLMMKNPTKAGFDEGSLGTERKIYIGKWIILCYVMVDVRYLISCCNNDWCTILQGNGSSSILPGNS